MDARINSLHIPKSSFQKQSKLRNVNQSVSETQNLAQNSFAYTSESYESVNDVRRTIKSLRKIAGSTLFPESNRVIQFLKTHPVITRVYFVSQSLALVGFFFRIPKLISASKGLVQHRGFKRFDCATKIIAHIGKGIGAASTTIAGFEAFQLGSALGRMGFMTLERMFAVSVGLVDLLSFVGSILAAASIVHKSYVWNQTRKMREEMMSQAWYKSDGHYTAKEFQLCKQYFQNMSDKETKSLVKLLKIEGCDIKKAVLAKMQAEAPSAEDLRQLKSTIADITGRLQTRQKIYVATIITRLVNFATIVTILVPGLEPLAALTIAAYAIAKIAILLFENIHRYHFENRMGMIERPGQTSGVTFKASFIDYVKWQIGLYDTDSPFYRMIHSSALIGGGLAIHTGAVSNIVAGAEVVVKIIKAF